MLKSKIRFLVLVVGVVFLGACQSDIKVACIGDSITNGGYPAYLDTLLGSKYIVLNCGEGGATMQHDGNKPYWKLKHLYNVFAFQPDVVVIMLGTNDSKTHNWNAVSYQNDYQRMIDTLRNSVFQPDIYLCSPPPAYNDSWSISDSTIREGVIPIVEKIASANNLRVIDVYSNMTGMPEMFYDGIHPGKEGKQVLAKIIADGLSDGY